VETAPPAIAVFSNHPDAVPEHYIRYLHNGFRAEYGFIGNPLRILMRQKNAPATDHRRVRGEPRVRTRWQDEEARESAESAD
jgi:GTP-binding protein